MYSIFFKSHFIHIFVIGKIRMNDIIYDELPLAGYESFAAIIIFATLGLWEMVTYPSWFKWIKVMKWYRMACVFGNEHQQHDVWSYGDNSTLVLILIVIGFQAFDSILKQQLRHSSDQQIHNVVLIE